MADEFFPNTFHLRSAGWTVPLLLRKRNDLVAGRNIFKEIRMCPSCFSLMFRNSDVIRKFLFPCRICFLLGFIKKIQLTIDIFPFFTGSTKKLLREILPIDSFIGSATGRLFVSVDTGITLNGCSTGSGAVS